MDPIFGCFFRFTPPGPSKDVPNDPQELLWLLPGMWSFSFKIVRSFGEMVPGPGEWTPHKLTRLFFESITHYSRIQRTRSCIVFRRTVQTPVWLVVDVWSFAQGTWAGNICSWTKFRFFIAKLPREATDVLYGANDQPGIVPDELICLVFIQSWETKWRSACCMSSWHVYFVMFETAFRGSLVQWIS